MGAWLNTIVDWFHQLTWTETLTLSLALFVASFVGSLVVVVWILVKIPADYFVNHTEELWWADEHPVLRWLARIAKNLLGLALIALGVLLSLPGVPGQGILTILIGIMLMDFPGKRRLELALVRRGAVLRAINRIRARYEQKPLVVDVDASREEPRVN